MESRVEAGECGAPGCPPASHLMSSANDTRLLLPPLPPSLAMHMLGERFRQERVTSG